MLIRYIKIVYKEELTEDMVTCPLANGTFKEYEIFAENGYLLENLDEDLKQKIIKTYYLTPLAQEHFWII